MRKRGSACSIVIALAFLLVGGLPAHAVDISLWNWAFNVEGTLYEYQDFDNLSDVPNLTSDGFDFDDPTGVGTDLGTLTWTTDDEGVHNFIAFFDHDIDEGINTYYNEFGASSGAAFAGQSWEIDEPGYVFGDIDTNVLAGTLDNTNAIPAGPGDDVSMAMGWDFSLATNETAIISLILSETMPVSGFYLSHIDPDSNASIYFSSTLDINTEDTGDPGSNPVPEPGTFLLTGLGLLGILGAGRNKTSRERV